MIAAGDHESQRETRRDGAETIKKKTLKVGGGKMSLSLGGLKEALASATTAQLKAELARREGKSTEKRGRPAGAALHRVKPRGSG